MAGIYYEKNQSIVTYPREVQISEFEKMSNFIKRNLNWFGSSVKRSKRRI